MLLYLSQGQHIRIGKQGTFYFPKGYYVYTGRAKQGLNKRIQRHLNKVKHKPWWHIDYLSSQTRVIAVKKHLTAPDKECLFNHRFLIRNQGEIIVPKFGASDCNCPAHLVYFKNKINL